jgi:hypothetical protein
LITNDVIYLMRIPFRKLPWSPFLSTIYLYECGFKLKSTDVLLDSLRITLIWPICFKFGTLPAKG